MIQIYFRRFFATVLLCAICTLSWSYSFIADGVAYNINIYGTVSVTNRVTTFITQTNHYSGSIVIPSTVTYNGKEYSVTGIEDRAFAGSKVTSVTIPSSVTSIGSSAFQSCSGLTTISIPNSVTRIGSHAFDGTEWYNNQPDGMVYTGKVAYQYKGTMPAGKEITIKEGTLGIADGAFADCSNLVYVFIPGSVKHIGYHAFYGCSSMTSFAMGSSVESIGEEAFYNTAWYNNQPNGLVYAGNVAYKYKGTMAEGTEMVIKYGTIGIADNAFEYCEGLVSVDISNSVTNIGNYSFNGCSSLRYVTIPKNVTSIGVRAFYNCGLTSLIIGESVKKIGKEAFYYIGYTVTSPKLKDVYCMARNVPLTASDVFYDYTATLYVPASAVDAYKAATPWSNFRTITALSYDFVSDAMCYNLNSNGTSVSVTYRTTSYNSYSGSIVIPSNVTYNGTEYSVTGIDRYAFSDCAGLTSITIPSSVTSIGEKAFSACDGLKDVYCMAEQVPSTSTNAFTSSNISKVTLYVPASAIEDYKATAPWSSFGTILPIAGPNIQFADATVKTICVANWDTNSDGELSEEEAANVTSLGNVFENNKEITSFNELQYFTGLTSIGLYAFWGCNGLTSITIPSSVTSIESGAFAGCSSLVSVHITDLGAWCNITFANNEANPIFYARHLFLNGQEIKDLIIPNGVTTIRNYAFNGCIGLTSVIIPNTVTSIGSYAFSYCDLNSLYVPSSVTSIGYSAFLGNQNLSTIIVDESNPVYDSRYNCNAIIETSTHTLLQGCKTTVIPNDVTGIEGGAFCDSGLTSVSIPNSVTFIGYAAFGGCKFTSVVVPNSVELIGDYAFNSCQNLTSITIGSGVTSIIANTFYNCNNLTSVTLESNAIVSATRTSSTSLKTIFGEQVKEYIIGNGVNTIGDNAFRSCNNLTSVTIGENVSSIGNYAFNLCGDLTSVTIGEGVTNIGNYAFMRCGSLTEATIPNSVTNVGNSAFRYCTALNTLTIGNSVNKIGSFAFANNTELADVTCLAEQIPTTSTNAFNSSNPENATLHVPESSIENYRVTAPWSNFGKIVALGSYLTGDANGNGEVEIGDVTSVLTLMATPEATGYNNKAADANGNGEIEIGDVTTILTIMAKGE